MNYSQNLKYQALVGKSKTQLESFAVSLGEQSYRGRQLFDWLYHQKKDTIDEMIDTSYNILDVHGAKNIEKFNGFKRKNWKNFITRYDNEDLKMMKRIKNKIELAIINNS